MSKVCFLSVQWLEEARYTVDNLLVAKIMSDYGQPLNPELFFYVGESQNNGSFLFKEALHLLFKSELKEEEEEMHLVLSNSEITKWINLADKFCDTDMFEAFRMAQKGLESTLEITSHWFDGEVTGAFTENGLELKISGSTYYLMYHEILDEVIQITEELKQQLPIWEGIYNEQFEGKQ
ncbi:hypothetical protein [Cytobacillus pseudoceanisediminis]|uniref:hypothetical protein n=1 Tax=Cytobacillus pseudoceanisediminis TaxID=3051614 RepID=UPI0001F44AD0|nr:hypothetical protein HMPREF1013_04810 [Bacillus sp. 2_A_57_CT2]